MDRRRSAPRRVCDIEVDELVLWGRLAACAAVVYRRNAATIARGPLWVGPIANRPQLANLPHNGVLMSLRTDTLGFEPFS